MTTLSNVLSGLGKSKPSRPLRPGVYAPIPSFFQEGSEDLGMCLGNLQRRLVSTLWGLGSQGSRSGRAVVP